MKKLLIFCIATVAAFADGGYGTADQPRINGNLYDIHRVYIEPNPGIMQTVNNAEGSSVANRRLFNFKPKVQTKFASDDWAADSSLERVLRKAAAGGKLGYVLDEAKKAKLPAVVAIIPIIESSYNQLAKSKRGAGSAWQLMPKTAKDYGLSPEGRFNFASSTLAAMRLLQDLHGKFNNWGLTLAAYNCGSSCVNKAMLKNPQAVSIEELSLPTETKDYVRKMMKLSQQLAYLD